MQLNRFRTLVLGTFLWRAFRFVGRVCPAPAYGRAGWSKSPQAQGPATGIGTGDCISAYALRAMLSGVKLREAIALSGQDQPRQTG